MARSKVRIVSDILETVKNNKECKKSKIVRLANLDWNMANKYLSTLLKEGFLENYEKETGKGGKNYNLTEDGKELLGFLKQVEERSSIF